MPSPRAGASWEELSRRKFLKASLVSAAAAWSPSAVGAFASNTAAPLRSITYNVYGCYGYTKNKAAESLLKHAEDQIPTRIALELALYQPDIITFQEAPRQEVVAAIAHQLNFNHGFFPSGYKSSRKDHIGFPGAILSRFEILAVRNCPLNGGTRPGDLFTRHWGRAVVKAPSGEVVVYSAHLHPSDDSVRDREVAAVLQAMQPDLRRGVALLFQGDLNHTPGAPEYRRWQEAGLADAGAGKDGEDSWTFSSDRPYKRIDYLWAHGPLASGRVSCRVLREGAFRIHSEDPRSFSLSDHLPVLAEFQ